MEEKPNKEVLIQEIQKKVEELLQADHLCEAEKISVIREVRHIIESREEVVQ